MTLTERLRDVAVKPVRQDLRECVPCKEKMLAAMKADAPTASIVIASRDEGERLIRTVESVQATLPGAEIVVVDDGSVVPVVPMSGVTLLRHETPQGCSLSRHAGLAASTGRVVFILDAHMLFRPGDLDRMARYAAEHAAIVYACPEGYFGATLKQWNGLIFCKWDGVPGGYVQTTGMMGACYVAQRAVWDRLGGWLVLPRQYGLDEEAMSLLAAKHNIPIICATMFHVEHHFRSVGETPYPPDPNGYFVNLATLYRLLFEDAAYQAFKPALRRFGCGDDAFAVAESPAWMEYGTRLRGTCPKSDLDLFLSFLPEALT